MEQKIADAYGNRLRVRVCGLCWDGDRLLLVNHQGVSGEDFWAPPGGGLEFGESVHDCLRKEFVEETGLSVAPGRFRFACEFIQAPLHAIELFFDVTETGGTLIKGDDPELPIIKEVRFMTPSEIDALPALSRHGILRLVPSPADLRTLDGFFRI